MCAWLTPVLQYTLPPKLCAFHHTQSMDDVEDDSSVGSFTFMVIGFINIVDSRRY